MRGRGWLMCVGAIVGAALFLLALFNAGERDELAYQACREANLPNAYIRLVLERSQYVPPPGLPPPEAVLPILSCRETVDAGRPIRLAPAQERKYLELVARRRLPVVRDGRVVGSEPLPAPRRHRRR